MKQGCAVIAFAFITVGWMPGALAENPGDGVARGTAAVEDLAVPSAEPIAPLDDDGFTREARGALMPPPPAALFTAVGRNADGSEVRIEPGDDIGQALLGRALAPAPDGSRSDPGAAGPGRQVFGEDDRVRITDTERYPYRVFGYLQTEKNDGRFGACSATLIGPRTVLTAAHCLYDHTGGGWQKKYLFVPGMNGPGATPLGVYASETAYILESYITQYKGFYGSVVPFDLGVVVLRERAGDSAGWLSVGTNPNLTTFTANIIGYPGDKPKATMWRATCEVDHDSIGFLTFTYQCDTYQGSSGSAVYNFDPATNQRVIYGVNVSENPRWNTAVRINDAYFAWIKNLIR